MGREKFDKTWIGMLLGILGLLVSFFGFAWIWSLSNNTDIAYYIEEVFLGISIFQDKILTLSVLFDVLLFALFFQLKYFKLCKGLLAVVLIAVGVILYLY